MNHSEYIKRIPIFLFSLTLIAFLCFFIYIDSEECADVFRSETMLGYDVFSDLHMEIADDGNAPAGMRKIYKGILPPDLMQEDYLCFSIPHHSIEVYFDDELVYSLFDSESSLVMGNVGSNWCIVHMGQNHAGKEITVVLTPLFEAAISKTPEFLLGAPYAVAIDLFVGEMSLLILSSLCILIGIFVVSAFLYFRFVLTTANKDIIYLGFFSIAIGLWKLTDLDGMSLLLPEHAAHFGYISVGSLFLTSICLMLYFSTLFVKEKRTVPKLLTSAASLTCLAVLAMQLFGITEIRQNLIFSHILLIVAIATVPITVLFNRIVYKTTGLNRSWKLLLLLISGICFDLIFFYINNSNGLLSFSILGLIVYTLIIFLMSIHDSTRKAYTDSSTGLVNRARWMELMNLDSASSKPYALLMIDMNGLKNVNDTLGHEAGDRMIFKLSELLRQTLPSSAVICRWGGDEFAVLLADTSRAHLDLQISKLFAESEKHNGENPELPLHFAVGAVLSSEHPDVSRNDLFRLADEEMYRNKKIWYENR